MEKIIKILSDGDMKRLKDMIEDELQRGRSKESIIEDILIPAMEQIGTYFEDEVMFVPEVLTASRLVQAGIRFLKCPYKKEYDENAYTVVIGTVAGDLHDIGKNILSVYFESKGYQVVNIGVDVTPEAFEKAVRKYHPQVLAMSASLTTTLPSMQKCMEHLEKKGLRKNMRIIVGGAPVTKQFAQQLNADFYADNAKEALQWLLENFII